MTLPKIILFIKHNIYLAVTAVVFLLSLAFAATTIGVLGLGDGSDETSVGFIYLGNYNQDQYAGVLQDKIGIWKSSAEYVIQFQDYEYEIELSYFSFDSAKTISEITSNEQNTAYFILSESNRQIIIDAMQTTFTKDIADYIDYDAFFLKIHEDLGKLTSFKTYPLCQFLDPVLAENVIDSTQISNINPTDVSTILSQIGTISITGKQRFSLLDALKHTSLSNEQLSIIASGIQKITMNTSLYGFVFQSYQTLPSWAEAGKNVRILKVNQYDFSFYSNLVYPLSIRISGVNTTSLQFELLGYPFITAYSTAAVLQTIVPYDTVYIDDETLDASTPGIIIFEDTDDAITYHLLIKAGVNGSVVSYIRTIVKLGENPMTQRLYNEETIAINAIIHQNTVEKVGD